MTIGKADLSKADIGVIAALLVGVLSAASLAFIKLRPSAAFVYALAAFVGAVLIAYSYHFFLRTPKQTKYGVSSPKMLACIIGLSAIGAILLEVFTLWGAPLSTPLELSDWSKRRILIFFVAISGCIIVHVSNSYAAVPKIGPSGHSYQRSIGKLFVYSIPGVTLMTLFVAIICLVPSYFVSKIIGVVAGRLTYLLICLFLVGVGAFFYFWKKGRVELFFLSSCLLLGSFLVFIAPPVTAISWDDEIHYDRALGLSYLGHSEYSYADQLLVTKPWAAVNLDHELLRESVDEVAEAGASAEQSGEYMEQASFASPISKSSLTTVSTFGYVPSAIGLWVARVFHVPILVSFMFGKMGNLISYAVVVAFAIRIIPTKELSMMLIGLLPTSIFLASNYSYDPVVTSFLMLAAALVVREISRPLERLTIKSLLKIVTALFLGLAPKAIYFPVIGLLLLMPRAKFSSRTAYKRYIGFVVAFGLVMVLSFVLPMLFSADAQAGDARGGSDVSASGQIAYILSHPLDYAYTLINFILGYISPVNSDMYSLSFSYMGVSLPVVLQWSSALPFTVLVVGSLIDSPKTKTFGLSLCGRLWVLTIVASSIALVCTALYVSFTSVGSDTIAGCQARYLTPLLLYAALLAPSFSTGGIQISNSGKLIKEESTTRITMLLLTSIMVFFSAACSYYFIVIW